MQILLQSLNVQSIGEFIQNLAQFGTQRNALEHPLAEKALGALSGEADFVDAR